MKIISQPKFEPCKCDCCKTVFQVESGDKIDSYTKKRIAHSDRQIVIEPVLHATCPVCGFGEVPLSIIGNEVPQSATD